MLMEQITVFIENALGRLSDVTKLFAGNEIVVSAMCLSDTTDFGVLRLIVDDPDKAMEVLAGEGFIVRRTTVLSLEMDRLTRALDFFEEKSIDVEYAYAYISQEKMKTIVIIRVDNPEAVAEQFDR